MEEGEGSGVERIHVHSD